MPAKRVVCDGVVSAAFGALVLVSVGNNGCVYAPRADVIENLYRGVEPLGIHEGSRPSTQFLRHPHTLIGLFYPEAKSFYFKALDQKAHTLSAEQVIAYATQVAKEEIRPSIIRFLTEQRDNRPVDTTITIHYQGHVIEITYAVYLRDIPPERREQDEEQIPSLVPTPRDAPASFNPRNYPAVIYSTR